MFATCWTDFFSRSMLNCFFFFFFLSAAFSNLFVIWLRRREWQREPVRQMPLIFWHNKEISQQKHRIFFAFNLLLNSELICKLFEIRILLLAATNVVDDDDDADTK